MTVSSFDVSPKRLLQQSTASVPAMKALRAMMQTLLQEMCISAQTSQAFRLNPARRTDWCTSHRASRTASSVHSRRWRFARPS